MIDLHMNKYYRLGNSAYATEPIRFIGSLYTPNVFFLLFSLNGEQIIYLAPDYFTDDCYLIEV